MRRTVATVGLLTACIFVMAACSEDEGGADVRSSDDRAATNVGADPLTQQDATARILTCLRALEPNADITLAIRQLEQRATGLRLEEIGEPRSGWLIQGGNPDDVGAAAWYVYEDTGEIVAALPSARAITPGPNSRLCRI